MLPVHPGGSEVVSQLPCYRQSLMLRITSGVARDHCFADGLSFG